MTAAQAIAAFAVSLAILGGAVLIVVIGCKLVARRERRALYRPLRKEGE